jgi:hypothetical protein
MKYIYYTILLIISIMSCKAQSPIVNIDASRSSTVDGAYFKDLNNEFNKFIGTWVYTNGTNTLTIELKKVESVYNGKDYEDKLVGEYKYKGNGIIIINTLDNISNNNSAKHNIKGNRIIANDQSIICNDCTANERRIELTFYDKNRLYLSSSIILRYLTNESNPEKINVIIRPKGGTIIPTDGSTSLRVPYGTYLMEKQ